MAYDLAWAGQERMELPCPIWRQSAFRAEGADRSRADGDGRRGRPVTTHAVLAAARAAVVTVSFAARSKVGVSAWTPRPGPQTATR